MQPLRRRLLAPWDGSDQPIGGGLKAWRHAVQVGEGFDVKCEMRLRVNFSVRNGERAFCRLSAACR